MRRKAWSSSVSSCSAKAKKIGINFDVKKVTTDGYWGAVWLKEPICTASWNMRPTANIMMTLAFAVGCGLERNPLEERAVQPASGRCARRNRCGQARKQKYCDLQTMIYEDNGMSLPACTGTTSTPLPIHVKGLTDVPLNNFGGAEAPVTLWRDDA